MITLYSGLVVKKPLVEQIIPAFESATGARVDATFEPTTVLLERIAAGERPDLVLGVSSSVTDLAEQGLVDPAQVAEIAVSSVGFARLEGAPVPADDSAAAFLDYLLAARAVAYTLSGASGVHFMKVLRERGLLERIDERAVRCESGLTVEALLDGRADVAVQQVSELRSVVGPQIVEPIPHELQSYGRFAIGARPGAGDAAARFVTVLTEKSTQDAFAAFGLSRP
ncbi:substrate-binding domain-containing protein [Microbacterium sp. Mcb102]|uniref:substrate-binding domain-containing protein n=1 Tax=Microbacterium sp. Mcb102 TaxID=2926012 RepID=UPI0021C9D083|nr:substrate-binding domain-containing protein [Microbacterium sp. Mcb102]